MNYSKTRLLPVTMVANANDAYPSDRGIPPADPIYRRAIVDLARVLELCEDKDRPGTIIWYGRASVYVRDPIDAVGHAWARYLDAAHVIDRTRASN